MLGSVLAVIDLAVVLATAADEKHRLGTNDVKRIERVEL